VLPAIASERGALRFDTIIKAAPRGAVSVAMGCGAGCGASLDASALFGRLAGKGKQTVKIPLACFVAKGVDLARVDTPFSVAADAPFSAAFANIDIAGGAAADLDALRCEDLR
jgi:beta-glucosidase